MCIVLVGHFSGISNEVVFIVNCLLIVKYCVIVFKILHIAHKHMLMAPEMRR